MSEARLYMFSQETKDQLRKFRLGTSRSKKPQAKIYMIDAKTKEIKPASDETYTDVQDVADELPDNSPRFILLSYPVTLSNGQERVPYVMVYYMPENCNVQLRMVYAAAKELMRGTAEVQRIIEIEEGDELLDIEKKLSGKED